MYVIIYPCAKLIPGSVYLYQSNMLHTNVPSIGTYAVTRSQLRRGTWTNFTLWISPWNLQNTHKRDCWKGLGTSGLLVTYISMVIHAFTQVSYNYFLEMVLYINIGCLIWYLCVCLFFKSNVVFSPKKEITIKGVDWHIYRIQQF